MTEPMADDNIVELQHKPTSSVVVIDPTTARRWLGQNSSNRNLRPLHVSRLARDMKEGRWELTGAPIQFAFDGRLLDGQHRLHAVIEADLSIPFFVVRGLRPEAQMVIDTAIKRSLADQLKLSGYEHPNVLAAGARLAFAWLHGRLNQPRASISDPEVREFVDDNPGIQSSALVVWKTRHGGMDVNPSVLCASIWILTEAGHDWDSVVEFFVSIAENRTEGVGDPRNTLSQRLAYARRQRERLEAESQLSMVIRAFNAYVTGKQLMRLPVLSRSGVIDVPSVVAPKGRTKKPKQ